MIYNFVIWGEFMNLITVEKSVYTTDMDMGTHHAHNFYEIYFLFDGTRFFTINNITYKIEPNTVLIVPTNAKHFTGGGPFERYIINVFPSTLSEEQNDAINNLIAKQPLKLSPDIMNRIKDCLEDFLSISNAPDNTEKLRVIFSYILFLVEHNYYSNEDSLIFRDTPPHFLFRTLDYIDNNLDKDLSLSTISEQIGFSSVYLRKQFKLYMKQSLYNYILSKRIDKAKNYLWNTHLPVNKISALCGFSSANYFALIFTKKEKISPSQYRRIHLPNG